MLKPCASLTYFRACFLPGRAKDLSALTVHQAILMDGLSQRVTFWRLFTYVLQTQTPLSRKKHYPNAVNKILLIPTTDDTPWEANKLSASQKILTFNGIRNAITGFIKVHQWSLFWYKLIQPRLSHTVALRHISNVFLLSLRNFFKCLPAHVSRPKFCMHLCSLPCLLHAPPHVSSLFYLPHDIHHTLNPYYSPRSK